jgi:hypothetical protein
MREDETREICNYIRVDRRCKEKKEIYEVLLIVNRRRVSWKLQQRQNN